MRDVERAFAHPRPSDALAPESVTRQLDDLRVQQPAALTGFDDALASVVAIDAWSREHLSLYAPDLSALTRLLRHLAAGTARSNSAPVEIVAANPQAIDEGRIAASGDSLSACEESKNSPVTAAVNRRMDATPADRQAALELIRGARQWFEQHEPSSPIPVLLRRAEQFVGKRYAEVVLAIPAELLVQWDNET